MYVGHYVVATTLQGHYVYYFGFRSEKSQNLMREGGKKSITKIKTSNLFPKKLMRATKNSNFWPKIDEMIERQKC